MTFDERNNNMSTSQHFAGFWNRFAALFIDVLILLIPQALFGYLIGMAFVKRMASADPIQNSIGFEIWSRGIALGIAWLYFSILESSKYQATIGKMALGLIVTDLSGNQISFGRASGRFFGKILSSIIFGLGYVIVGFTAHKQALHDILSKCLVLKATRSGLVPHSAASDTPTADDEQHYLTAQKELDSNSMREGLWAMAFEHSPTDDNLRRAKYINLRVNQLRADTTGSHPSVKNTAHSVEPSPFVNWFRTNAVLIILITIASFAILGTTYRDQLINAVREYGMTSVTRTTGYVHVVYYIGGIRYQSKNNYKVAYRGDTIYIYDYRHSRNPDTVIRGADNIIVTRGPALSYD